MKALYFAAVCVATTAAMGPCSSAFAALPSYIDVTGIAGASAAMDNLGHPQIDSHSISSDGPVQQSTFVATTGAAARAAVAGGDINNPIFYPQAGDGSVQVTATMGGLRGIVAGDSSVGNLPTTGTSGSGTLQVSWADQLTFHTSDPLGADYTYSITLAEALYTSLAPDGRGYYPTDQAQASASAQTSLTGTFANGAAFVTAGTSRIFDILTEVPSGGLTTPPNLGKQTSPSLTFSGVLHVTDGMVVNFVQSMGLSASVYGANGTATANAGDTAYFNLATVDQEAWYSSASDTLYATSGDPFGPTAVPEPSDLMLMTAGLSALALVLRRKHARY